MKKSINIFIFLNSEFKTFNLELTTKPNSREGVDYLIGDNQINLKSIDLDTTQRSIKILKGRIKRIKRELVYHFNINNR